MVDQLAQRYGTHPAVQVWQIDNELGHEGSDLDFSANAGREWGQWLQRRYHGDITALNQAWGNVFWGATLEDFAHIELPKFTMPGTPTRPNEAFRSNMSPGLLLDYRRFRAESITSFSNDQAAILRKAARPGQRLTTNAPGGVWGKAMDHSAIFAGLDMPAYDNYPVWGGSTAPTAPSMVALSLATVRGWGANASQGFMVSEMLIGAQGHDIIGYTPRPQQIVAWAAQTLAHGATELLFFRYRAAAFGQEEFCYGVLDHTTPRGTGRKWREAKRVFALARQYSDIWLTPIHAKVLLLYDTDNIFAWQAQPQSTGFDFQTEANRLYHPFWRHGIQVAQSTTSPTM